MSSRLSLSMNASTIPAAQRRITAGNGHGRRKTLALAISATLALGLAPNAMAGFPAIVQLSALDGTTGFRLDGAAADDESGRAVSAAGDINGDGVDDLLIGAYSADPNGNSSAGSSYVVFGNSAGFPAALNLASLNGTDGFRLDGVAAFDQSGFAVSAAGDVNGDGFDDLLIGAFRADPNGSDSAGSSYVVFGNSAGFPAALNLASLNGTNGFRLDGVAAYDQSGRAVSAAGDVNGDGFDDLLIGAFGADPNGSGSGSSYVVFGNSAGFPAALNLASFNGTDGFRLDGVAAGDVAGEAVSGAGDVNGDGIDDLLIAAPLADPNGNYSGSSYVVFGNNAGFPAALNLASLNGTDGFRLDGVAASDVAGRAVSAAGDVNGDGFDDLLIGAYGADPNGNSGAGSSYVVFGGTSGPGLVPAVGITPASLAFGNVPVGTASTAQTVTVENTGSADLNLGTLALSGANPGDFALGNDTCSSQTIAAAATCTFDVTLTPSATGMRNGQVDIPSNVLSSPDIVNMTGTGVVGADLALRKRDCADPNRPGGQVTYLLQARNQGPADATSVMVDDSLPDGMTLVDSIPSGLCSDTGMGMLNCDLGALSAGAGLEFSIIAAIDASVMDSVLANVAVISGAESDPVAANNFGTEFTQILSDLIFADNMEKCTPD